MQVKNIAEWRELFDAVTNDEFEEINERHQRAVRESQAVATLERLGEHRVKQKYEESL